MGRDGGGDERHHGLVRRLRVRRLHRPGWIKSQEHPQHCQSLSERVAKSTSIHRAETSSVKAEIQVKSIQSSARWLGNRRRSQSQGMDAGEVSHRVRMDELRPVVPGPSCS